jgi:asparagine synthase (glutamine-hydrolysing)
MCGIAGIILRPSADAPDLLHRLRAMAAAMAHRGPDDEGCFLAPNGRLGLANRRLAIRDLSPAGRMPMAADGESVWITYNGEIYNAAELRQKLEAAGRVFRSQSDTEVILNGYLAWGDDVLMRLRGMFAFAIADGRPGRQRVLLARDRLGIKPLYYAQTPAGFVFASELKGLLASGFVGREIDPAALAGYLLLGSVPTPLTIYGQAAALEPGCWLEIDAKGTVVAPPARFWRFPTAALTPATYEDAVGLVRQRLQEAVHCHLVSDVPLGVFLSGGLDSSAIAALMRQATTGPIRTCAMVFEEAAYSEATFARVMAEAVGAEHFERVVTATDLLQEFDHILAALDQPSVDGVNSFFVSQTARQAGLTVALSGLGGDELFGGYANTFIEAQQVFRGLRLAQALPRGAGLVRAALGALPNHQRWARTADALARPASLASAYLSRRGLFAPGEVEGLIAPGLWEAARRFDPVQHIAARADAPAPATGARSTFAWTSRAELSTYTQHQLLRDTDAMSMAHSLEVRVPLLDAPLVETVLQLPDAVKLNHRNGPKPLLAAAVRDLLPRAVYGRSTKVGFTFPFEPWLRGPLAGRVREVLAEVQAAGWLRAGASEGVWRGFLAGRVHWSRVWALAALGAVVA